MKHECKSMTMSPALSLAGLATLLALAVVSDLRSRRIPNELVLTGLLLALGQHAAMLLAGQAPLAGAHAWSPLAGALARGAALPPLPRAPQTPEDTGLPHTFLVELVGKAMYQLGFARLMELSQHLCLAGAVVEAVCHFMRREGLLEVLRRGQHDGDVQFELTQAGHARAADWLVRNQYVGPAPVSLEAYRAGVLTQSLAAQPVDARRVHEAFADLVVSDEMKDRLGTAINSGRPLLLYGPSGSGKTYLASHLRRL